MLKAAQCLRISTCTPSPSTLNPLHPLPKLKVYLRLRFSDVEGLNVNTQSTDSLNTPIQTEKEVEAVQWGTVQNILDNIN